jgi:hypothetical protein
MISNVGHVVWHQDFERMVECQVLVGVHQELADFCSRLAAWLQRAANLPPDYSDFNSSSKVRMMLCSVLDPDPHVTALILVGWILLVLVYLCCHPQWSR